MGRTARDEAGAGAPLIITEDPDLLDDLLRLCAAAGAEPWVHHSVPEQTPYARGGPDSATESGSSGGRSGGGGDGPLPVAGGSGTGSGRAGPDWTQAPLVLVGDDVAGRVRGAPRRPGVVLVGRDQDDPQVWQRAVEIGAERVLRLPEHEAWLVDRIADVAEGAGRQALTVGVIGGSGGAGASTLACALALAAARTGEPAMLIDGDPLGGGLDVLLGGETAQGLRWPDFVGSRGRVGAGALADSLPEMHSLRVLSWDRGDRVVVPPAAMRSVLAAARRRGGAVVVDLPRRIDEGAAEALAQLDLALLVVPGTLRAVAAASRVAGAATLVARDLRLVARGPYAPGLDPDVIAGLLKLPLAGELPPEPALRDAHEGGEPPGARARSPLGRFCTEFWARATAAAGAA
ncbi:septum formation initiator [Streptomyces bambusae]|uniref:septum site-determining protein Ssd n=1 Tax=Streptomyces bambusae TaxID=1550616 RepID=UPI001CFC5368|nr:septum site-determining protein Ssd [Streptomyces bambusae]MCB5166069.1 septum formation initiator [Streptomyces bambusae]